LQPLQRHHSQLEVDRIEMIRKEQLDERQAQRPQWLHAHRSKMPAIENPRGCLHALQSYSVAQATSN